MSNDRSKTGTGPAAPQGPTRNTLDTDGMLSEWGARLFYPIPGGKGGGGGGKLPLLTTVAALTAVMSANEVRSRVRNTRHAEALPAASAPIAPCRTHLVTRDARPRIAPWGGLLSTASKARGAAGCVTDGLIRDTAEIRRLGLPVYHRGIAPLDSKGRGAIREVDVPVFCDDVRIEPGDLIFGDADGVVVVPAKVEAQVLEIAFTKLKAEGHSMRELRAGSYLRDVYAKYGVL